MEGERRRGERLRHTPSDARVPHRCDRLSRRLRRPASASPGARGHRARAARPRGGRGRQRRARRSQRQRGDRERHARRR